MYISKSFIREIKQALGLTGSGAGNKPVIVYPYNRFIYKTPVNGDLDESHEVYTREELLEILLNNYVLLKIDSTEEYTPFACFTDNGEYITVSIMIPGEDTTSSFTTDRLA